MPKEPRKPDDVLSPDPTPPTSPDSTERGNTESDTGVESPFPDLPPAVERLVLDLRGGLEQALKVAQKRGEALLRKGRYTRVRVSFKGREIANLPLVAFVAVEALAVVRISVPVVLILNVIGKMSLTVEFINEAVEEVAAGRAHLLDGDLDEALTRFRQAVEKDPSFAEAHLRLGIALRMKGEGEAAAAAFERALQLDPEGESGSEAKKQLEKLERG